jgi:hypothetical protein
MLPEVDRPALSTDAGNGRNPPAEIARSRRLVTAGEPIRDPIPLQVVTLREAAAALGITAQTLKQSANNRRNGFASDRALAGRLGIVKPGRDWLVPRSNLERELERRRSTSGAGSAPALDDHT